MASGQALARALAREGVVVAIGDLDANAAEAAAAELANGSIGLALDVTDRRGFTAFLDEVEKRLGPLDILVNNAGIMMVTPLDEEDEASITRQLAINLQAVIHGTQEAMKRMRPRAPATSSTSPRWPAAPPPRAWPPTAPPSTA